MVGLALPHDFPISFLKKFYSGLKKLADEFNIEIVGGDLTESDSMFISITLIGYGKKVVPRSGARINDLIVVTGNFGDSKAGLEILLTENNSLIKKFNPLIEKHLYPPLRVEESKKIIKLATSMIDSSDGLLASVYMICKESRKGATINLDSIPISQELQLYTKNPYDYALYGGEDYELVFTIPKEKVKILERILPDAKIVGEIVEENKGIKIFYKNKPYKIEGIGFQHWKKQINKSMFSTIN